MDRHEVEVHKDKQTKKKQRERERKGGREGEERENGINIQLS